MIKQYLEITKPGIIIGNLLTTIGGFLVASKGHIPPILLLSTVAGLGLVIASGCVFNNYLDRKIDRKMSRTRNRALALGTISTVNALIFGTVLGCVGFAVLYTFTNNLATMLAAGGFVFYVVIYGYFKRHSPLSTLVGSIPGAIPVAVGYCAYSGRFDLGAVLLFLAMAAWQMPHFYAISIFRHDDYKNASLPVLSVVKGIKRTKQHILVFSAVYLCALALLFYAKIVGYSFLVVMMALGTYWMWYGTKGLGNTDSVRWARKMFFYSLVVLLSFSIMLSLNFILV